MNDGSSCGKGERFLVPKSSLDSAALGDQSTTHVGDCFARPLPIAVVSVKVDTLRKNSCPCCGEKYQNLESWLLHPNHVYVGRRVVYVPSSFDSEWRNPYPVGKKYSRDEALRLYRIAIRDIGEERLSTLRGKVLGCWCAPSPCHADILKELAEAGDAV